MNVVFAIVKYTHNVLFQANKNENTGVFPLKHQLFARNYFDKCSKFSTTPIFSTFKPENTVEFKVEFNKNIFFSKTKLKNRVSRYKTKEFKVTLSKEIPGYIYQIETYIKDLEDPDDMVKESLVFQGIKTNKELREDYKKRKDDKKL